MVVEARVNVDSNMVQYNNNVYNRYMVTMFLSEVYIRWREWWWCVNGGRGVVSGK